MRADANIDVLGFSARQKVIVVQILDPCRYNRNVWLVKRLHLSVHFVELGDLFPDSVASSGHMLVD